MNFPTTGVVHLALRSSNLNRSRAFYVDTLGFIPVLDTDGAFVFVAGTTVIGVLAPAPETTSRSEGPGLDHIALGVESLDILQQIAQELTGRGVEHSGIKQDEMTGKSYVAFTDPDGIWWEAYLI
jgi:catechol 2,3-dioxygenase-like lactoylglutathione lyase family enzyme